MGLPSFIILGCQKGGTSSLYDLMCTHPLVQPARAKELHYFSLHFGRGLEWYRRQFVNFWPQVSGEATPYYLFHPLAAERIASACPKAKLIVLLRDPVDRALSQYFHSRRLGLETLGLWDALQAEPTRMEQCAAAIATGKAALSHQEHSYVARSRYSEQLKRYQRYFPAQQMLVINSSDFFRQPEWITQATWKFLGLPPWTGIKRRILNQGNGEADSVDPEIRAWLERQLADERDNMQQWVNIQPHL